MSFPLTASVHNLSRSVTQQSERDGREFSKPFQFLIRDQWLHFPLIILAPWSNKGLTVLVCLKNFSPYVGADVTCVTHRTSVWSVHHWMPMGGEEEISVGEKQIFVGSALSFIRKQQITAPHEPSSQHCHYAVSPAKRTHWVRQYSSRLSPGLQGGSTISVPVPHRPASGWFLSLTDLVIPQASINPLSWRTKNLNWKIPSPLFFVWLLVSEEDF